MGKNNKKIKNERIGGKTDAKNEKNHIISFDSSNISKYININNNSK